ncbi:UNVERIFIED_ORG: hypothetical protein DFS12_1071 [Chitinophaga ginsengisegetis]|jgi:hypothetical protein|nr:amino acid transporter [Chitinophaga ginsengisegetis]MDR6649574.1 amino acid transporter [Chitinophaga ginsengisegetis]MDR6656223.1 amino acid transporter [Chitinophaga ginsengisegetis]
MSTRPVLINLLLFTIISILFIAFAFAFGYASNPVKYPIHLMALYTALVCIHLFLNYYWCRKVLSLKSLLILSIVICLVYIFLYKLIA